MTTRRRRRRRHHRARRRPRAPRAWPAATSRSRCSRPATASAARSAPRRSPACPPSTRAPTRSWPGCPGRSTLARAVGLRRPGRRRRAAGPTCGGTAPSTRSPTAWCSACPPAVASWPAPACCRSAGGPGRPLEPLVPRGRSRPTTSAPSSAIASAPRCSTASSIRWSAASTPATRATSAWPPPRRRSRRGVAGSRSLLLGLRASAGLPGQRRRRPPVFLAPRGGMQALVDALAAALGDVRVLLGQPVEALEPAGGGRWLVNGVAADAVLLALPAAGGGAPARRRSRRTPRRSSPASATPPWRW